MLETIFNRRSIRKFKSDDVSKDDIETIIKAGMSAPSAKNRQPWKFIVVSGNSKKEMIEQFQKGLDREKNSNGLLADSKVHIAPAQFTLDILKTTPVTIFVINTYGVTLTQDTSPEERIYDLCNMQSIGACLENMTLTATELGLGSLWVCDIYFAHKELSDWLNFDGELVAAMTFGYADEKPAMRKRKSFDDIVQYRD